ncbi:uncharacterized protein MELLADRAFT_94122 [Melampsora larici-populina 98AG31]|uniref:non-specific serine/threonine protein kinase n=1 Tax=Melampsora larici-populina (strain 98AG31 / pathotype 3-4-7) TaxID=747676 RepID=F4S6J6_MELLP|nr:uncharacterized protein MELLADRAFT_94122 [Melampsora larici-populina 98AG31]EGF99747.1 hypothetical protein MELLADRAFT_94122 [Melampsora larici-populina 98AG31]
MSLINFSPTLPGYKFMKQIGEGSYGEVWAAYSLEHQKMCAIKLIPNANMVNYMSVEKILDSELRGLEAGGELYQCSLTYNRRLWPTKHVKFFVAELAVVLDHLHRKNIVYRDLKPDNVLVNSNGHVKLTDFGLAQYIWDIETGVLVGTLQYMSPEMLGGREYGFETDWYSLGCLAFEMLTASYPGSIDKAYSVPDSSQREKIRIPFGIDSICQEFVNRLLEFNPSQRISSLDQIKLDPWMKDFDWDSIEKIEIPASFEPKKINQFDLPKK